MNVFVEISKVLCDLEWVRGNTTDTQKVKILNESLWSVHDSDFSFGLLSCTK